MYKSHHLESHYDGLGHGCPRLRSQVSRRIDDDYGSSQQLGGHQGIQSLLLSTLGLNDITLSTVIGANLV